MSLCVWQVLKQSRSYPLNALLDRGVPFQGDRPELYLALLTGTQSFKCNKTDLKEVVQTLTSKGQQVTVALVEAAMRKRYPGPLDSIWDRLVLTVAPDNGPGQATSARKAFDTASDCKSQAKRVLASIATTPLHSTYFQFLLDASSATPTPHLPKSYGFLGTTCAQTAAHCHEWIDGESLDATMPARPSICIPLVVQLANAVKHLHDVGIAHRQVSLKNVLVRKSLGLQEAVLVGLSNGRFYDRKLPFWCSSESDDSLSDRTMLPSVWFNHLSAFGTSNLADLGAAEVDVFGLSLAIIQLVIGTKFGNDYDTLLANWKTWSTQVSPSHCRTRRSFLVFSRLALLTCSCLICARVFRRAQCLCSGDHACWIFSITLRRTKRRRRSIAMHLGRAFCCFDSSRHTHLASGRHSQRRPLIRVVRATRRVAAKQPRGNKSTLRSSSTRHARSPLGA
jgi:serine/threonine protein kinase